MGCGRGLRGACHGERGVRWGWVGGNKERVPRMSGVGGAGEGAGMGRGGGKGGGGV